MSNIEQKDPWGPGIPEYTEDDVMAEKDLINFAMEVVFDKIIKPAGYTVVAAVDKPGTIPNFVLDADGQLLFLVVKPYIYEGDMLDLSFPEKKHLAKHAAEHDAKAFYCMAGLSSMDPKRAEASLALKNDGYNIRYSDPREIIFKKSPEWIKQTLEEINELDPARGEHDDDSNVRYSLKESQQSDFEKWKNELKTPTFQEMLMTCINKKGISNVAFYKAAFMDRKLFSAIKNNRFYQPKKDTAAACCFGLELPLPDAEKLLKMAGFSLSMSISWDRIVYYCLKKKIYDLDVVNELLYEEGQKCIGVVA